MLTIHSLEVRFDVAKGSDEEVFARLFERHIAVWQRRATESERRRRLSEADRRFTDQDREQFT